MWANLVLNRVNNSIHDEDIELVKPFFDEKFYQLQLEAKQLSVTYPIRHYLTDGWNLNLDPSPYFSSEFYLKKYHDVRSANVNPLVHYLNSGKDEGREISPSYRLETTDSNMQFQISLIRPYFDVDWYTERATGLQNSNLLPLEHYLRVGWLEGLDPSASFSTVEYRSKQMSNVPVMVNPLVHYAMFGSDKRCCIPPSGNLRKNTDQASDSELVSVSNDNEEELIEANINSQNRLKQFKNLKTNSKVNTIVGNIDGITDGKLYGWFLAPSADVTPILFVNNCPVTKYEYPVARPDVNETLGFTGNSGFIFDVGGISKESKIELYVLCNSELVHVASHNSESHFIEENFISQLNKAYEISQKSGAVAVTCWEGTHNAIGRAKALYDVVSSERPSLIITYSFSAFGNRLWRPICGEDICILMIPWANRAIYERAIIASGIKFDTVWIGKGRFPSFELAKLISKDDSSLVLDFDDNEEHFSRSDVAKNTAYGVTTINYARYLTEKIPARTAASITLKNDFQARLVRHARYMDSNRTERKLFDAENMDADDKIKIGFIGTVRQHKNLTDAARAIRSFNWVSGLDAELHVYGDVNPPSLLLDLKDNGVVLKGNVPMTELYHELGEMDIVLTGFPNNSNVENDITKYQISSKIGDALSVGRPVLVPDGESVADLKGTPGVFLFNAINFSNILAEAIDYAGDIALSGEFTIDGAYAEFAEAENLAKKSSSASDVFSILPDKYADLPPTPKTLVLLWKQNDSGFYGRRVDQIARSYKRLHPSNRVIILELMHEKTQTDYEQFSNHYTSEHRLLLEQATDKRKGKIVDGVEFHQIMFKSTSVVSEQMNNYLLEQSILPMNSAFIVFPIIQNYQHIERSIRAYPKIIDVVDNQFYWGGSSQQSERITQYYMLLRSSETIVFNSEMNKDFFVENKVVRNDTDCKVIPNWYELPSGYELKDQRSKSSTSRNVIYSGNMNDRIDWALLDRIADLSENITLHIVGTATRSIDSLVKLLEKSNVVYHGPLSEKDTLRLTQNMDLAIMPHTYDDTSAYMNPLKLKMYQTIGIPAVSTDVPGIEESKLVKICKNHHEFLGALQSMLEGFIPREQSLEDNLNAVEYVEAIEALIPTEAQNSASVRLSKVA